jgi:hypothetical protein
MENIQSNFKNYFMNKEISVTALKRNLAFELDHLCKNKNNSINT